MPSHDMCDSAAIHHMQCIHIPDATTLLFVIVMDTTACWLGLSQAQTVSRLSALGELVLLHQLQKGAGTHMPWAWKIQEDSVS